MKELLELLRVFEKRNNISTTLLIHSDGSSSLQEFWDETTIEGFDDNESLVEFLETTEYKLGEDGRCLKPFQKVN